MINDCFSFGRDVISNVLDEIQIQYRIALIEYLLDDSNLLCGKVYTKGVEVNIESSLIHNSGIVRIELFNICITRVEIFNVSSKQLELEFVIDFRKLIDPIHF